MAEFPIPEVLEQQTVDNIHERMLEEIDDIDKSEGSFLWDCTRPSATELSYFSQFILPEGIRTAFPKYSYGTYLDDLAKSNSLSRKEALFATGTVTVTGTPGTEIPLLSVFSTASTAGTDPIEFVTTEATVIPDSGTVDIPISSYYSGAHGNVSAGTIVMKSPDLPDDITGVTNTEATTGGVDAESDDSLRQRIEDVEQSKGVSYVGSKSDYKRWAEEVDGVGEAIVVPAQDNSGTVTIILTDANGNPASTELCTAVYNHIMGVLENQDDRLANINAKLVVNAPALIKIAVSAAVELTGEKSLDEVKNAFVAALNKYLIDASNTGTVRYSGVTQALYSIPGIADYSNVLVNGGTANITVNDNELAVTSASDITLTEGA